MGTPAGIGNSAWQTEVGKPVAIGNLSTRCVARPDPIAYAAGIHAEPRGIGWPERNSSAGSSFLDAKDCHVPYPATGQSAVMTHTLQQSINGVTGLRTGGFRRR